VPAAPPHAAPLARDGFDLRWALEDLNGSLAGLARNGFGFNDWL
jgi:hypothetical protein